MSTRKRYIVNLEKNGKTIQVVIIARNLENMYRELYRLYGDFLTEERGKDSGTISFEEIDLFPTLKQVTVKEINSTPGIK